MAVRRALIDYQGQVQAAKFHLPKAGQKLSIIRPGQKNSDADTNADILGGHMAIVPVAGVIPCSEIWFSYTGTRSPLYVTQPS